ncbi:MAG: ADP-ribosylglycohydrolase family protein [Bacteroidales bacterium]|nr:ADP-ribosylglycohydrolase family protein [Bacteroidales bacterium]
MLGAIIGDTVGSIYEGHNIDTTEFPFFVERSHFTDDSVMTIAVAEWLLDDPARSQQGLELSLVKWGHKYPHAGYGGGFRTWLFQPQYLYNYRDQSTDDSLFSEGRHPYNSYGNGSAMRASACGWLAHSLDEALDLGKRSAIITHNHPEGVKGAQAVAAAIYLARTGATKEQIRQYIEDTFAYDLSHSCDGIRPEYYFDSSCQGTMPAALAAFFDSHDFESAVRLAVSLGGDSDTIACITGGIAEAFYHDIPAPIIDEMHRRLPDEFWLVINALYTSAANAVPQKSAARTLPARITPHHIAQLKPNEVFVFGSNAQGMHYGGAAAFAVAHFGAVMGNGEGMQGQTYAIPTMEGLDNLRPAVERFIEFAKAHTEQIFLVTPIGCGIAGYEPEDIAPMFAEALPLANVYLPQSFIKVLTANK